MDDWTRTLQESYDRVAGEYTARIVGELAHKPRDRAVLDRFAGEVRSRGPVCDLGCGPGHVARYLHEHGLTVVGVDLSSEMLVQGRRLNPEIIFRQGTMLALDFEDAAFGGIVAFYSIIHVPRPSLATAFGEMWRTLRPGGSLLLAFHLGEEDRHVEDLWGTPVSMDFLFFDRGDIEQRLTTAGFTVEESFEREPYPDVEVQTRRAYLTARKPDR